MNKDECIVKMKSETRKLNLSKVIKGRENWKERAKEYQFEKRKYQDKIRYLEIKLNLKEEKLRYLSDELKDLKKKSLQS